MAYTKILVIHDRLDKSLSYAQNSDKTSLETAIDYAMNREKTESVCFETAINCELEHAYHDMVQTKSRWGKESRKRKGYHIIQSFAPGETVPQEAHEIGVEFASGLLGDRYEAVVTTHLDKAHLHNHIVFNSVSFVDGAMYKDRFADYYEGIRGLSDELCAEHGLSVIVPDEDSPRRRLSRPEWEGKTTIRDTVRRDIDGMLGRAYTFRSLVDELRRMGYRVNTQRKHISLRPPGANGNIRLDSLGEGYSEEELRSRIAAYREGSPPQNASHPAPTVHAGRRYRIVRGGARRRLTGFQKLCFRYLYLLGGVRPRRYALSMSARQELAKMERYRRQFRYLRENRIETAEQLAMQYDAVQASIDALVDDRRELYPQKRSGDEWAADEIERINERLRSLRRQLRMCARIEQDTEMMRNRVSAVRQEKHAIDETKERTKSHTEVSI